ncbi:NLR, CARD domain containing 5 [Desmophyllum pertusum]|uniref:NLR, CARD domain containing 5 n=1 Tax=Desmophyllum pertusum TaxID=174260 RepID=A0A9X0CJB1_9CNID|nr:NLR, CARD domain containing 5 [Desmophyllum pertusum]
MRTAQGGNSATEEMPFSALYVKLAKGKQLSGATVLTTCRPNVVQSVAGLKFDRTVEIMGFTPEKVQEYVERFCAYDTETVQQNMGTYQQQFRIVVFVLHSSEQFHCLFPFWKSLIKLHEEETASTLPTTSTEVYEGALRLFLFKHHPEFKGKPLTKGLPYGQCWLLRSYRRNSMPSRIVWQKQE